MPVVSPATFARLLRTLDGRELAAFVGDLWAARGWETTVERDRVVALDGARDRQVEIQCLAASRPWPPAAIPEADVIVSSRDVSSLPSRVEEADSRLLGPDGLREQLLYAVDRAVAAAVFADHFDRPLVVEPPSPGPAGWRHAATSRQGVTAGLLVVLAVAVALAATGSPVGTVGIGQGGESDGAPATAPVVTEPPTSPDDDFEPPPAGGGLFRYPPGLGSAGVTDAATLAAAHRRAVDDRRWDLLLVHRGSTDLLDANRRWVGSRQTVDRSNASRYWYRVTGLERRDADTFQSVVYDDYADGDTNYRRVAGTPEPTYHRTRLPAAGAAGVFATASAAYVHRYLETTESRVELVDAGPTGRYRVIATGIPRNILLPVSNYTAVAVVGRDGLVYHLTVEFTRLDRKDAPAPTATPPAATSPILAGRLSPGTVRFRFVFRDLGDATVAVPDWYDEARNATNGTEAGPWPNEPSW